MPIYSFENIDTEEEFELELSMSERESYLAENPNVRQILTRINLGDSVRMGISKPPSDFTKYVLGRIKETNPGATGLQRRTQIPKEV